MISFGRKNVGLILTRNTIKRNVSTTTNTTEMSVNTAREYCENLIKEKDRSSYILNGYIPRPARDAFLAIRAFNIDTAKISDSVSKPEIAKVKFEFWKSTIQKIYASKGNPSITVPSEPVAILLSHCLNHSQIELSKRFFITIIQTREAYINNPPFRNLDAMASYGEGTYSQLNYLTQEALYSISPTTSKFLNEYPQLLDQVNDIVAHIGQATGITSMLRGFTYFVGRKSFIPLPIDLMTKHDISQESILQTFSSSSSSSSPNQKPSLDPKLNDVIFETATRANDHLISASTLLQNLKTTLEGSLPDAIFVPTMTSIPAKLFLEKLEKNNFDIIHPSLSKSEWRLPYRSYISYKFRKI